MTENTNDSANPVLTFEGKKYLINELSNEIKESIKVLQIAETQLKICLLYTSPSPRDRTRSRMPSSA